MVVVTVIVPSLVVTVDIPMVLGFGEATEGGGTGDEDAEEVRIGVEDPERTGFD